MAMAQAQWEMEGELLQVQITLDKLRRKEELTAEERERAEDLEKRKKILQEALRKEKMRGH